MTPDTARIAEQALRFAREELGPASERLLGSAAAQALVLSRLRAGRSLQDAVLGVVHLHAAEDRRIADEFLTHFLQDAYRGGRRLLSAGVRRFLETGDLVHSVAGELWTELASLRFETRAGFLALLQQRMQWRARDEVRKRNSLRRGENRRAEQDVGELEIADSAPTPGTALGGKDEAERLVLLLCRLPERDQLLLRLHLRGEPLSVIARESGLQPETARKALQRAIRKVRELA